MLTFKNDAKASYYSDSSNCVPRFQMKKFCPECAEEIDFGVPKCQSCGKDLRSRSRWWKLGIAVAVLAGGAVAAGATGLRSGLPSPQEICGHVEKHGGFRVSMAGDPIPYDQCIRVLEMSYKLINDPGLSAQLKHQGTLEAAQSFARKQGKLFLAATKPEEFRCLLDVQVESFLDDCLKP